MKNNRIWLLRLALILLMIAALCISASAAGSKLTVKPTTTKTNEICPGQTIYLCQITYYDHGHHLTDSFADTHLSIPAIAGENANKYAGQIRDYIVEHKIDAQFQVTGKDGKAVFSNLSSGIYVVYPKDTKLFAPFIFTMGTTDLECEPKVEKKDPDPTDPTKPTDLTTPTKPVKPDPPYTGDDSQAGLFTIGLIVGLFGLAICAILPLRKHYKKDSEKPRKKE